MKERKIKVCYVISSLCSEGPVNILYGLLLNMDYRIFSVSIITFNPEKKNSKMADFKKLPVQIIQLAERSPVGFFRMYWGIKKILRTINPDIIHGNCPGSMLLIPLMLCKCKKVFTPHNFPGKYIRLIYGLKKGIIVQLITKVMINFYDKVQKEYF